MKKLLVVWKSENEIDNHNFIVPYYKVIII